MIETVSRAKVINFADKDERRHLILLEQAIKGLKNKRLSFPLEALPDGICTFIETLHTCYGLPRDYFAQAVITAAATALGGRYYARYKRGQYTPAILWSAVVGYPSTGKTPALKIGLQPLEAIEKSYREEYRVMREMYAKELANWQANKIGDPPDPPVSRDLIVHNSTLEALVEILERSPSLLMFNDELKGWINSMNAYRQGGDTEEWLSMWGAEMIKMNRTSKDVRFVPHPFVCVIGGIQPGVLGSLTERGMDNGFIARILWAYPDDMDCPEESDHEPSQELLGWYKRVITYLVDLPTPRTKESLPDRLFFPLSPKAKTAYKAHLNGLTRAINASDSEEVKAILGKLKTYTLRLALILHMLEIACRANPHDTESIWQGVFHPLPSMEELKEQEISLLAVERAIVLTQYYQETALKVVGRTETPVGSLPERQKIWYEALPESFNSALAYKAGAKAGISKATVGRLLSNTKISLFVKKQQGEYEKRYI